MRTHAAFDPLHIISRETMSAHERLHAFDSTQRRRANRMRLEIHAAPESLLENAPGLAEVVDFREVVLAGNKREPADLSFERAARTGEAALREQGRAHADLVGTPGVEGLAVGAELLLEAAHLRSRDAEGVGSLLAI